LVIFEDYSMGLIISSKKYKKLKYCN
jgi:hypothetical protein